MPHKTGFLLFLIAGVLCCCVLSFHQTGNAQTGSRPTLSDPAEERRELIANLEAIKNLLKEQNALLRSGQVKVIVTELPKAAAHAER
jgi:hypothetical protein